MVFPPNRSSCRHARALDGPLRASENPGDSWGIDIWGVCAPEVYPRIG